MIALVSLGIKSRKNTRNTIDIYIINDLKKNNIDEKKTCLSVESYLSESLIFSDDSSCNNKKKKARVIIKIEHRNKNLFIVNCILIYGFSDTVTYQYRFSEDQNGFVCISKKQVSIS